MVGGGMVGRAAVVGGRKRNRQSVGHVVRQRMTNGSWRGNCGEASGETRQAVHESIEKLCR